MTGTNGFSGRLTESAGGTIIDRRFGSLLIINDGLGGDVAIDVDRVVSITHGTAQGQGGAMMGVVAVLIDGAASPTVIACRGVVAVSEAVARAREQWILERSAKELAVSVARWDEVANEIVKRAPDLYQRLRASAPKESLVCPACEAKIARTCPCCRGPRNPTAADLADVEGRAARAAGGGSGIAGTALGACGIMGEPLGAGDNPHLDALERTGEIANLHNDPDHQAASEEERAQKEIAAADDRAVADLNAGRLPRADAGTK